MTRDERRAAQQEWCERMHGPIMSAFFEQDQDDLQRALFRSMFHPQHNQIEAAVYCRNNREEALAMVKEACRQEDLEEGLAVFDDLWEALRGEAQRDRRRRKVRYLQALDNDV